MKLLMLPGFSLRNREEQVLNSSKLTESGFDVYQHQWRHWIDSSIHFDVPIEVAAIMDHIGPDTEYAIITKSLGGFVGINLINQAAIKPRFAIFMGVGAKDLQPDEQQQYPTILAQLDIPITFIHNIHDDHGGSAELVAMLGDSFKYELIEKEADDHRYVYPDDVLEIVKRYAS